MQALSYYSVLDFSSIYRGAYMLYIRDKINKGYRVPVSLWNCGGIWIISAKDLITIELGLSE